MSETPKRKQAKRYFSPHEDQILAAAYLLGGIPYARKVLPGRSWCSIKKRVARLHLPPHMVMHRLTDKPIEYPGGLESAWPEGLVTCTICGAQMKGKEARLAEWAADLSQLSDDSLVVIYACPKCEREYVRQLNAQRSAVEQAQLERKEVRRCLKWAASMLARTKGDNHG